MKMSFNELCTFFQQMKKKYTKIRRRKMAAWAFWEPTALKLGG